MRPRRRRRPGGGALGAALALVPCLLLLGACSSGGSGGNRPTVGRIQPQNLPPGVLLQDDFSNPRSGWLVSDTADASLAYRNGQYRIFPKRTARTAFVGTDFNGRAVASLMSLGDISIDVDVREENPTPALYGVFCRQDRPFHSGYLGAINGDG